jgi:hypothetical protein
MRRQASFDGRTAAVPRIEASHGQGDNAARQLLVQIAVAIKRPRALARAEIAS